MARATDFGSTGGMATGDRLVARREAGEARSRTIRALLWTLQGLLASLFLFAGATKLALPAEALTQQLPLPVAFLRFIGVCEFLGGLGLVLPALLRIRPGLTPLAAALLVVIMIGATALTAAAGPLAPALLPLATGLLLALVAYGRWRVAPIRPRS